jgi:hypothetical protein
MTRALGTVINWNPNAPLTDNELYTGVLDYFDWWFEIDPRLAPYHDYLSPPAFAFGRDLVIMATYVNEILRWLHPKKIWDSTCTVIVAGMAQAFLFSMRSACDALASILAYAATKPGQAPDDSLRKLIGWAGKNQSRVHPEVLSILSGDLDWFWKLRRIRDRIAHGLVDPGVFTDRHQFDLILMATKEKRPADREPLLPLLAAQLSGLLELSNQTAYAVNKIVGFPSDRIKSRVVCGVFIPALHTLIKIAPDYSRVAESK